MGKKIYERNRTCWLGTPHKIVILGIMPPSIPYESSLLSLQTVVCRERMELLTLANLNFGSVEYHSSSAEMTLL